MHGALLLLGVPGPVLDPATASLFRRIQPSGFLLFARNLSTPGQTRALTDELRSLAGSDTIIAVDQEGGRVTRTRAFAPALPPAADLGRRGDRIAIAKAGALTADLLRLLGINTNLAPVLDLDHFPGLPNAIGKRCWGRDPQRVIDHAGMFNRWQRKRSLRACAKHFPAGGRATGDPHHELPVARGTLDEILREDVIPYTALMPEIDAVMTAHVEFPDIDPGLPASCSRRIVTGFLRDQLGFDKHLVLTDDLDMGAITSRFDRGPDCEAAILAGNDLAVIGHRVETADAAVDGLRKVPSFHVQSALERIERFRKRLHGPLRWSEEKFASTCTALAELAAGA